MKSDYLALHDLHIAYRGAAAAAVHGLNLTVPQGQLISLLGPSGCGKTTTMRAVAGLLAPQRGRIELAGEDSTRVPAHRRDIGLVFQSYALFPHLSAHDNVAFGLRLRKRPPAEVAERTQAALASVGLAEFAQRLPAQLSGGQQQRVALARAIVIRPRLLLLDEPLSNLDARLRVEMRAELRRLQRELGITMLYVTHDQDEALAMSDRVVILREGRIEQDGPPEQLYERPATAFVATFMGFDNLYAVNDGALVGTDGRSRWPWPGAAANGHLAWRAEHVAADADAPLRGPVRSRSYRGDRLELLVQTPLGPFKAVAGLQAAWREGDIVGVRPDPARAVAIAAVATP